MNNKTVQGLGKNDKGSLYLPSINSSTITTDTINTNKLYINGIDFSTISQTTSSVSVGTINNTIIGNVTPAFGRFTTLDVVNTTASTSSLVGALTSTGGISINNITDASSFTNGGSFTTAGGIAIAKKAYIGGTLNLNSSIAMSYSNAAINIGSFTSSNNPSIYFHTSNTGSIFVGDAKIQAYGGTGVVNSATIEFDGAKYKFASSGYVTIEYSASSISTSTGGLVSLGGIAINKTTNAFSSGNGGSLTVGGGVGIAKRLYVGESLIVESNASGYISFPNLSTTQRDALTALPGMMIFNSTTFQINYYNGTTWVAI